MKEWRKKPRFAAIMSKGLPRDGEPGERLFSLPHRVCQLTRCTGVKNPILITLKIKYLQIKIDIILL